MDSMRLAAWSLCALLIGCGARAPGLRIGNDADLPGDARANTDVPSPEDMPADRVPDRVAPTEDLEAADVPYPGDLDGTPIDAAAQVDTAALTAEVSETLGPAADAPRERAHTDAEFVPPRGCNYMALGVAIVLCDGEFDDFIFMEDLSGKCPSYYLLGGAGRSYVDLATLLADNGCDPRWLGRLTGHAAGWGSAPTRTKRVIRPVQSRRSIRPPRVGSSPASRRWWPACHHALTAVRNGKARFVEGASLQCASRAATIIPRLWSSVGRIVSGGWTKPLPQQVDGRPDGTVACWGNNASGAATPPRQ
jgi:hypothetical protein